ncbi:hypothetical protein BGZ98_007977 [Dissophora globulifera]|nr:hypothetical protein BGZ98_007977 [Dissophora globulifera]
MADHEPIDHLDKAILAHDSNPEDHGAIGSTVDASVPEVLAQPQEPDATKGEDDDEGSRENNVDSSDISADAPTTASSSNDHPQETKDQEEEENGFGDFGGSATFTTETSTTSPTPTATITAPAFVDDDNGGFGDFDDFTAGTTHITSTGNVNEEGDDDGFGDFGEVQAAGDGDDDEFGDFNDFADGAGDDAFGDSGDFGDFEAPATAGDDDVFGEPEPAVVEAPAAPIIEETPVETAPDFNADNSLQVETYVLEKLAALYPIDDDDNEDSVQQFLNPDLENMDMANVLADQELWTALCEESFQGGLNGNSNNSTAKPISSTSSSAAATETAAPQFQWKYSDLRKEFYASLGLVAQDHIARPTSSIPNAWASPTTSTSKVSSPLIVGSESVPRRQPLDAEATQAYCQFTKENLGGYSGDEMKDIIARLTELTRQASEELTYWLDQREQMIMDSERYNEMIASLVGRAAKLKDQEMKQNTKNKKLTRTSFSLK